jgi:hypothetical protein
MLPLIRTVSFEQSLHGRDSAMRSRLPDLCNWPIFQMSTMIIGSGRQRNAKDVKSPEESTSKEP